MTLPAFCGYAILLAVCGVAAFLHRKLYWEIRDSRRPWWTD